jgi:hypothetical protein
VDNGARLARLARLARMEWVGRRKSVNLLMGHEADCLRGHIKGKSRGGMSVAAGEMIAYKHLAGEEEIRVQMSACAMSLGLDGLVGHVWANGRQETEYGKGFTEARDTAHAIRDEVTADWKSRYVYAPERYATARKKVDDGMTELDKLAGFEDMKACGKKCQEKMDAYAEVWRKIREFDASHWNAYTQRTLYRIHAFSDEKKASMEEMLRELHVLSVGAAINEPK